MKKEPIYRVKVELIGEQPEGVSIDESLLGGVECNGFVLLGLSDCNCTKCMQNVTTLNVAEAFASDGDMMAAATIAIAMREAMKYAREKHDPIKEILKSLIPAE